MEFCPVIHVMTNPLKGSIRPVPHINEINLKIEIINCEKKKNYYLTCPLVIKPDEIIGLSGVEVDCGFRA